MHLTRAWVEIDLGALRRNWATMAVRGVPLLPMVKADAYGLGAGGQAGVARAPLAPQQQIVNASHMMIANPFRTQDVSRFFATHPPMGQRIARLENMAQR